MCSEQSFSFDFFCIENPYETYELLQWKKLTMKKQKTILHNLTKFKVTIHRNVRPNIFSKSSVWIIVKLPLRCYFFPLYYTREMTKKNCLWYRLSFLLWLVWAGVYLRFTVSYTDHKHIFVFFIIAHGYGSSYCSNTTLYTLHAFDQRNQKKQTKGEEGKKHTTKNHSHKSSVLRSLEGGTGDKEAGEEEKEISMQWKRRRRIDTNW